MFRQESNTTRFADLQAPEPLEFKTAPMFMCCGHWSYGVSLNPISFISVTITWVEDGDAACADIPW